MKKTLLILSLILLSTASQYAQDKPAKGKISAEERKAANQATKAKVDSILNNEQDAKMSEIRKKRREYRKN